MNFEKYYMLSLIDVKPVCFKIDGHWLAYWKGILMPAELALNFCARYYFKIPVKAESFAYIRTIVDEIAKNEEIRSRLPNEIFTSHCGLMWFFEQLAVYLDLKYSFEELYKCFRPMLTRK
jgi:hypothetical protein